MGSIGGVLVLTCFLKFQDLLNGDELLKIIVSIMALFTTFGGSYLGAKISGENAIKLSKKENMINNLRGNLKTTSNLLDDFKKQGLRKELENLLNNYKFEHSVELNEYKINFDKFKKNIKVLLSK